MMKYVCWVATRTPRGIDVKTKRRSLTARAEKKDNILFLEQPEFLSVCLQGLPGHGLPGRGLPGRGLPGSGLHKPEELAGRDVVAFSYFYDLAVEAGLISGIFLEIFRYRRPVQVSPGF